VLEPRENRVGSGFERHDRQSRLRLGRVPWKTLENPRAPIALATKWQRDATSRIRHVGEGQNGFLLYSLSMG
jgi:hypothetical protein